MKQSELDWLWNESLNVFKSGVHRAGESKEQYIYAINESAQELQLDFKPAKRQEGCKVLPSTRVRTLTTGSIKASGNIISGVEDAPSLLASIRKASQELAYTINTDKG